MASKGRAEGQIHHSEEATHTGRCIVYARLSVETEASVSIERQVQSARDLARARGWEVAAECTDSGVSASKVRPEARPGWRKVIEAVSAAHDAGQPVAAVVVWAIDRLARNTLDLLKVVEQLDGLGTTLVAVKDPVDFGSASGKAFSTLLAVIAEMESANISARVKAARSALLRSGRKVGGRAPYGFRAVDNPHGPGMVLAQDPETIGYVTEAAERAMSEASVYSIARWLDSEGAPLRKRSDRTSPYWSVQTVETMLRAPALAGLTPYAPGRLPGQKADPWAVLRDDDGVPIIDESLAVLSLAERRELLATLDAAKSPGSRPYQKRDSLLSRLCHCETCGAVMHRSRAAGVPTYTCRNRDCPRPRASINAEAVEREVVSAALERMDGWRISEWKVYPLDPGAQNRETAVDVALRDTARELVETDNDEHAAALLSRIATLKQRRADARADAHAGRVVKALSAPTRGDLTWPQEWEAAADDPIRRQTLLREVVEYVDVAPVGGGRCRWTDTADRLTIHWAQLPEGAEPEPTAEELRFEDL